LTFITETWNTKVTDGLKKKKETHTRGRIKILIVRSERRLLMEKCKHCDCTEFIKEKRGPHIGVYCCACGTWRRWEKQTGNEGKTNEDYKNEYLDKQPATPQQIAYIRNLQRDGISKFQANRIIEILKGEVDE
jgi:hypothetical protein